MTMNTAQKFIVQYSFFPHTHTPNTINRAVNVKLIEVVVKTERCDFRPWFLPPLNVQNTQRTGTDVIYNRLTSMRPDIGYDTNTQKTPEQQQVQQ